MGPGLHAGGGGSDQCGAWASCWRGGVTSVGPGLHAGGGVTSVGLGLHAGGGVTSVGPGLHAGGGGGQ